MAFFLQYRSTIISYLSMCQRMLFRSVIVLCFALNSLAAPTDFRAFGNQPIKFTLTDDTPADHLIGKLLAPMGTSVPFSPTSAADNYRQLWRFHIFRPHKIPGRLFRIDSESGELYTHQMIDRETLCPELEAAECILAFQVTAQSKGISGVPHFIDVNILVVDRNDHIPEFPDPGFVNISVPESTEIGTRFRLPLARDPDTRQYSVKAYVAEPEIPSEWSLVTETESEDKENFIYSKASLTHSSFSPDDKITGLYLKLQKPLDHETKTKFAFRIQAIDGSETNQFAPISNRKDILQVYIHVDDINDNGPVFRPQGKSYALLPSQVQPNGWMVTYTTTVPESEWIKYPILKLVADDLDGPANSKVYYYYAPATTKLVQEYFTLNPLSGYLFLRKPLDYELQSEHSFRVIATDTPEESPRDAARGELSHVPSNLHTATAQVVITVTDTNDGAPEIEVDFISSEPNLSQLGTKYAEIEENDVPPQFIASIQATDMDAGLSGQVSCTQQPVLNPTSSMVALWSKTIVNPPSSPFQLDEIRKENGRVQYRLLTRTALDREDIESGGAYRQVKIICTDMGQPQRTSSAFVNIKLRDKNDNAPTISLRRPPDYVYASKPTESDEWPFVYENAPVGSLVARMNASDLDEGENSRLTFSLESDEPPNGKFSPLNLFQVNEKTGDITTIAEIDREASDPPLLSFVLQIKVSDNGIPPKSATKEVRIYVRDENDNNPIFQSSDYRFHVMENLPAGYAIGEIVVTDKDEGEIQLNFGMQTYNPLPFTIWPSSIHSGNAQGAYSMARFILNTTRPLDRELEHYFKFNILAKDGPGGHGRSKDGTATATVEIIVENENDNDPTIIFPQKQNKTFYLSWRERENFELLTVNANDRDPTENPHIFELTKCASDIQMINYSTENKTEREASSTPNLDFLSIEPTTGIVFLSRDMRAEDKGVHVFKVKVTDAGVPPRSSSITFFVLVDDSLPRSPIHESNAMATKVDRKPVANIDLPASMELNSLISSTRTGTINPPIDVRSRPKPRIASDLVVLLALGLVFLLLIVTLSLVIYFRYWKKQSRLIQANGNRGSLMFSNQVNHNGNTCMKDIQIFTTKQQQQWLCTSDGSMISISPSQLQNDGDILKSTLSSGISPSNNTGNIYYKAKTDTLTTEKGGNDSVAAYSSLTPMNSVVLKPRFVPGCEGYCHPESQLAYYAQNAHVLGTQPQDRSHSLPHVNTMSRTTHALNINSGGT